MSDYLQLHQLWPATLLCPRYFPGKNTGVGCHLLLQGIFPTQGLNLGLLHRRRILYHLSHQGSPDLSLLQIIFQMATRGQTGAEHRLKINKPSLGRIKSVLTALLPCLSSLPSCSSQESRILSTYFPFATFSLPVLSSRTPPHPSILSLSLF